MGIVVQKYGGTSVAGPERIKNVAQRVCRAAEAGNQVVVVVSAQGDTTDRLLDMAYTISPDPPKRELDMLLATGEQISISLLAMAIDTLGRGDQPDWCAGRYLDGRAPHKSEDS